jgi:hypothetical protein
MCACTDTDMRELVNDCTLASGEGHGSCGETFHPIYAAIPVSSAAERSACVNNIMQHEMFYGLLLVCVYFT